MEKDYLLEKWLNNTLTASEREEFEARDDYEFNARILENAQLFRASGVTTVSPYSILEKKLDQKHNPVNRRYISYLLRIAAILVVAIGVYFAFLSNSITTISTLASQKESTTLPDSSEVLVNSNSELSYSTSNWNKKRAVDLSGEAYFKVAKGKSFDVTTNKGIITVIGTQFNVKVRDQYFEVVCYEGKVKVNAFNAEKELTPGAIFRWQGDSIYYYKTKDNFPSWTNNVSEFDGVLFSEVVSELERQYDLKIQYKSKYSSLLFTGGFVHNNLENALQSITQPLNLSYEIESSKKVRLIARDHQ